LKNVRKFTVFCESALKVCKKSYCDPNFFQFGCNNETVLADYDFVEGVKKCMKKSYEQKSVEKDAITKILKIRIVFAYKGNFVSRHQRI
jgi:hypothetical protein